MMRVDNSGMMQIEPQPTSTHVDLGSWGAVIAQYLCDLKETTGYHAARGRFMNHVLPALALYPDVELRRCSRGFIKRLFKRVIPARAKEAGRPLKPKTIWNCYRDLHAAIEVAIEDRRLRRNPCKLRRRDLPPTDQTWRTFAFLELEELRILLTDERIALYRRHYYRGLSSIGARRSELSALLVRDWNRSTKPLTHIPINKAYVDGLINPHTKTGISRLVPVSPELAEWLDSWLREGFRSEFGRDPKPTDPLFPAHRRGRRPRVLRQPIEPNRWKKDAAYNAFQRDIQKLGLRRVRLHDLRRTWRTLAMEAGVAKEYRDWVTHAPAKDVISLYESVPWPTVCKEVMKLRYFDLM